MHEPAPRRSLRQHLVGLGVLVHLVLVVLVSAGETPYDEGPWGAPGRAWNQVHHVLASTVRLYGSLLGPKQSWGMFGSVATEGTSLHLEVVTTGGRELVYRERSDEADWHRLAFDHYRWREWMAVLGRKRTSDAHLQRFVDWVGPVLADEDPAICEVIATLRVADALTPEELRAGQTHDFSRIRRRKHFRVPGRTCRP